MKKFGIFSGFLGSGKTTTLIALTKTYTEKYGKAAMISNDLGHGVSLADNRLAKLQGCNASEITEDCICYKQEELADRLNACFEDGCDLVLSDIPGFGVGALEHVYHGLNEKYPGKYQFAPFTVIIEPDTVAQLIENRNDDLEFILSMQLEEADLIVLNKCDTIEQQKIGDYSLWLEEQYPSATILPISAVSGEGLEELSLAMKEKNASMRRIAIDYSNQRFIASMASLSEYYIQFHTSVCCNTFDGNAYLLDIATQMQQKLKASGADVPHLKLLAWGPEGDYGKADLIGVDRPVVQTKQFEKPCTDLAVILNASAICQGRQFQKLMQDTLESVSEKYQLESIVFKEECFDMGE